MRTTLRVALFSVDPPGLTLFRAFDPDSFFVIPAINDGLVYIDADGAVRPALATSWKQVSPVELELELRRNVRFHDGAAFDANDVVASFAAHAQPTPSAALLGVLMTLKSVTRIDDYRVRIETHRPDAMLMHRLFFFSIYPKGMLATSGRDGQEHHPVGTGAYKLLRYDRGRELVLERNTDHWANAATVDVLRLPIMRQKEWVHRLSTGEIDVALNLDSHDRLRAERIPGLQAGSREADVSQWFLLRPHGPLADVRVRRALNHAINRRILVDLTEHGFGTPQRSLATVHTEGHVELDPYRYSPELSRRLLAEAGYPDGFSLNGMVSESSTAIYFAVREFLARVGVSLEADIRPRATCLQTLILGNITGNPYQGDFAVTPCDNPVLHALFVGFVFFASQGTSSLTRDPGFDERASSAAAAVDDGGHALREMVRYHRDQALMLFTVQQHAHAAWRSGVHVVLPRSGHFDAPALWGLAVDASAAVDRASLPPRVAPAHDDLGTLLDGTSHTGAFYLPDDTRLQEPTVQRIWTNLTESEKRWRIQNEPMLRELVSSVEARTNLNSVLASTDRVAIVGYSPEGKQLFRNRGYELMFGTCPERTPSEWLGRDGGQGWLSIEQALARDGVWVGPVHITCAGRPAGAPLRLFLTVSPARDEDGVTNGYTFVLSDFSGEEERIKTAATRNILEHVPYGLFMVDRDGRMMAGYSDACRDIFAPTHAGSDIEGREITSLLGLDARRADHFLTAYGQVMDDIFPPEVSLGQLPSRVELGERTFSLHGSVVRDDVSGDVQSVLFTLSDISALVVAEREAERRRATVLILRFRASFESFAREFYDATVRWSRAASLAHEQTEIRAALHTAKGVLSQFALHDLAAHIHSIEDLPAIDAPALAKLQTELHDTLRAHDIDPTRQALSYTVSEDRIRHIEDAALAGEDSAPARARLRSVFARLRERSAADVLGPVAEAAEQLVSRRDKRVRVELTGGETCVPPHAAAVFATAIHLVRNAVDHGIEPDGERGPKDPTGRLTIAVSRSADAVRLTVSDDGRGIDEARVVERAIALGALTREQARMGSRSDRLGLIFIDGLTTAREVTQTSGRGVGVAATKAAVEAASGTLDVESTPGEGTVFTITIPLVIPAATPRTIPFAVAS